MGEPGSALLWITMGDNFIGKKVQNLHLLIEKQTDSAGILQLHRQLIELPHHQIKDTIAKAQPADSQFLQFFQIGCFRCGQYIQGQVTAFEQL